MTNYPSNLTDNQWNLIKNFLPKSKPGGYERKHLKREMLNAIFYLNKTGVLGSFYLISKLFLSHCFKGKLFKKIV